ncbi:hypothetical protein BT63DRAFT_471417 [Microthyrium microscopicum]|uniref:Uncharacterized protein n=1 Tax=Microthyrium microscopicum TaxID=703497 RepID=A0A6A6U9K7_9PEZI|nr:hypothetical protein BT63DRAFT_471417 [Microthyrium microscopicum]
MATTTTASLATATPSNTYITDWNSLPSTLSSRTRTRTRTTATTTPSFCSIYSDSGYTPNACGGAGYLPTYTPYTGINNNLIADLDAQNAALDRKLDRKIIYVSVVGGCMVLLVIVCVIIGIRRRRRQRKVEGQVAAMLYQQGHGVCQEEMQEPGRGLETGVMGNRSEETVVGTENGTVTTDTQHQATATDTHSGTTTVEPKK